MLDPTESLHNQVQHLQQELHAAQARLQALADGADSSATRLHAQQQMSVIFSHSPTPISLSRLSDGVFVDVNARWMQTTGLSLGAVLGRSDMELGIWNHPIQRSHWLHSDQGDGRLDVIEMPFVRPDGERRILQHSASKVEIAGTDYLLVYLRDVTQEHATEAELLARGQLLKASNARLAQQVDIFEELEGLAAVGYWIAALSTGTVEWSNGLYRLSGLPVGSITSFAQSTQRIHPQDIARLNHARRSLNGAVVEYRWLHPDGKIRWVRSRMRRWHSDGERLLDLGVVQDITAEREAALALQEKLGFIQKITSRAPGVVFQLRRNRDASYQFVYVGDPIQDMYRGITPEQVQADARYALKTHHPDDLPGFFDSIAQSARTLEPWHYEYRLLFANGDVRWLLGQAVPERDEHGVTVWNGFVTDITERRRAQDNLQASEARFRALTDLSSDWYWEQDAQFRFVRIDGNMSGRDGLGDDALIGKTRWESGIEGVSASEWAKHRADLYAHRTFHDFQVQRRHADGALVWASISGAPIFDAEGIFVGYRGIGRDITERKRDEDRIERLAFYDSLTGLPNRRLLMDRLHSALALCERDGRTGAILFIDLDNFKDLNDTRDRKSVV